MLLLAAVLLAQGGQSLLRQVVPQPTGTNGYEEYLRAADLLRSPEARIYADWQPGATPPSPSSVEDEKTGLPNVAAPDPHLVATYRRLNAMTPLDVRREELARFGRVLDLVRAGNAKGATEPRAELSADTLFPEYAFFKNIGRFAARAATVYAAEGRTDRATEVLLDELEFSDNYARGPLIAGLVGVATTSISLAAFGELLPRLSRSDALRIERATDSLLARPPAARSVLPAEFAFVVGSSRKAIASGDAKGLFYDPEEEKPDPEKVAMAREFERLGRSGREALFGRLQATYQARLMAMDRVLAQPEAGWVAGFAALSGEDDARPEGLEGALADMLFSAGDLFGGFVGVVVRSRTQLRLLGLHARLIQSRWDYGHLPESLDVPDSLTGGRYLYERRADGTIRLASKGLPSTGEIEMKYKRPPAQEERGAKP